MLSVAPPPPPPPIGHLTKGQIDAFQGSTAQAVQYRLMAGDNVGGRAIALLMLSVKTLSGEWYFSCHALNLANCSHQVDSPASS